MDSFLNKNEISQNQVGYLGLTFILAGSITGFIASMFLELKVDSKKFVDPLIKFFSCFSTFFLVL